MASFTLKWNQDRVITRARRTMLQRGEVAAAALEAQVTQRVSTPYPPASLPGQPPHRRSGRLMAGIRGIARLLGTRIRITVGAAARIGRAHV